MKAELLKRQPWYDIKKLRGIANVKQYQLAKMLGIEQCNYANIENGTILHYQCAEDLIHIDPPDIEY